MPKDSKTDQTGERLIKQLRRRVKYSAMRLPDSNKGMIAAAECVARESGHEPQTPGQGVVERKGYFYRPDIKRAGHSKSVTIPTDKGRLRIGDTKTEGVGNADNTSVLMIEELPQNGPGRITDLSVWGKEARVRTEASPQDDKGRLVVGRHFGEVAKKDRVLSQIVDTAKKCGLLQPLM